MESGQTVDILVIGGGIIGLASAYENVRRGRSVAVVEHVRLGAGATHVAAGMLAGAAEAEPTQPAMVRLAIDSLKRYAEFVGAVESDSGLQCGYDTTGTLLVAMDQDHLEQLCHGAAEHGRLGLHCEQLDAEEIRRREPRLSPSVVGGFAADEDVQVDPRALARAVAAAIEARGGTLVWPAKVLDLELNGRWRAVVEVPGDRMEIIADRVIVAAGAWTRDAAEACDKLPLRPVKGQVLRLRGERLLHRVIRTPDVYILPRASGELVIGASSEEQGFDARPTAGPIMDLLYNAWRALPGIYELELDEVCVGFRPALRDHLPAIGATEQDGMYVATGHYRNGILLAPATAALLADLMDGDDPELLKGLEPGRFAPSGFEEDTVARQS